MLLGWSCGAVAAMRVAQCTPVRGLVLVAPYHTDLGIEAVRKSGFVSEPWSWNSIRRNCEKIAIFHSDQDPYISQEEFKNLAVWLRAENNEIGGAGHFGEQETFPQLTDYLLKTYG